MKKLVMLSSVLVLLVVMVACGEDASTATNDGDTNDGGSGNGVLTMGTSADYEPFQFIDLENNNEIIGFDVDLARHIAAELGYELEIVDMNFNSLITALRSGRVDMVLAGMTPTSERLEVVDFSDIYHFGRNVLLTFDDVLINSLEDLNGIILGAQSGSIQADAAVELQESGIDVELREMDRIPDLVQQLLSRRIDAIVIEEMVTAVYLENNENFVLIDILEQNDKGSAVALPQGSELTEQINAIIAKMQENGELEALAIKWFQ